MKLTEEAKDVLETSMLQNKISDKDRNEIEQLIDSLPEDRVLIYKNVDSNPIGDLERYSLHIRIQHMLSFVTFLTLAFTGLPILFFNAFWAEPLNSLLGGINITRIIHRTIALIMILTMVYHFITITFGTLIRIKQKIFDVRRTMIPLLKDFYDFRDDILYFAGRRDQRPLMDKFMYKQKIHYFAAAFGNAVLIVSGSSFLFPEIWASILPEAYASYFQELMRLSHPHEALLALLVIAFWHWYNVHLAPGRFPMQWTFISGKITREHQIEEHFLEYLRNLVEVPEERKVLHDMLNDRDVLNDNSGSPKSDVSAKNEGSIQ